MRYAIANPDFASTMPASSGPSTVPTLLTRKFSVLAAATRSAGTKRGMIAPRTGEVIANPVDWTATTASNR